MARIAYTDPNFRGTSLDIIEQADRIAVAYARQGYTLTLRQLYYQFVARDLLPNKEQSYDKLGRLVSEARLAGLIDWDHIVDRTRSSEGVPHWDSPQAIMDAVASQFRIDKWEGQRNRPEVWVEKEALVDVVATPAKRHDLRWFACRGYASQSSQHEAAMRFVEMIEAGQHPVILHLGDHDPSGVDMTRDITDRINLFVEHHTGERVEVQRLALNMDQIRRLNPPPNPAKMTDSRAGEYVARYGYQSWELDALDPPAIDAIVTKAVEALRDDGPWSEAVENEDEQRRLLAAVSEQWDRVVETLE